MIGSDHWVLVLKSGRRVAERIRRAVAALEPNLVRAVAVSELDEEIRIERDPAVRTGVAHHLDAAHALRIELPVPCAVERVGEIDALAVAADLDHLRTAVERPAV